VRKASIELESDKDLIAPIWWNDVCMEMMANIGPT
jgi:hypothetical protein